MLPIVDLLSRDPLLLEYLQADGYSGNELTKEARRAARRIAQVELGLTLLRLVDPNAPASAVRWLLTGYRYDIPCLVDEVAWARVQRTRQYLVRLKGRVWREVLREYLEYPSGVRLFVLTEIDGRPELPPGAEIATRYRIYQERLDISPSHRQRSAAWAGSGRYYVRVLAKNDAPRAVAVDIPPEIVSRLTEVALPVRGKRSGDVPNIKIAWADLKATAAWMDEQLLVAARRDRREFKPRYVGPFGGIQPLWLRDHKYAEGDELTLAGLLHVVGLLNVGKSTFLEVLACHLARLGYRVAIILRDVPAQVEKASLFRSTFGLAASPVLGARERLKHLEAAYSTKLLDWGEDIHQGAAHPAQRWFSPICPLLPLAGGTDEELWGYGDEPCEALYETPEGALQQEVRAEDGEPRVAKACRCPFLSVCPRRQLERDMAEAQVWFLNRASWIQTHTPVEGFSADLLFSEAVYMTCDVVLIDEADRIQVELDEDFAPDEVLVDTTPDSFLNRTGKETAAQYLNARAEMKRARYTNWSAAEGVAQTATNRLYHLLMNRPELVDWLGESPFTGRSVWARLVRDLAEPVVEPLIPAQRGREARQKARSERLQQSTSDEVHAQISALLRMVHEFTRTPLAEPTMEGEWSRKLSRLSYQALWNPEAQTVRVWIRGWLSDWLKAAQEHIQAPPVDEPAWEQLVDRIHFAILLCVLDDQLRYVVDNLPTVRPLLDLEDVGVNLVNRPSLEYLAVIPEAPVGNILGFQYRPRRAGDEERGQLQAPGGTLTYFRYTGVGRSLLMEYPNLFAWDGLRGPHTLLISGTSFAPGSPTYHIDIPPGLLLAPADPSQAAQMREQTRSRFWPQRRLIPGGVIPISVSGRYGRDRREAIGTMTRLLATAASGEVAPLAHILQELRAQGQHRHWQDRERALLVTGSYAEAELVKQVLVQYAGTLGIHPDEIALLGRDRGGTGDIRRGEVDRFSDRGYRILIAPLLALERGHNILNAGGKAAFGAVLFLVRPMPVPDSWQPVIQGLNAWTVKVQRRLTSLAKSDKSSHSPLDDAGQTFYRTALAHLYQFSDRPHGYRLMTDSERTVLCMTQLVSIWQLIGRLVRGNVPAHIYFVDAMFAPVSAGLEPGVRKQDTWLTSLLVGMHDVVSSPLGSTSLPEWQRTLYESLYGIIASALGETEGLV